MRKRGMIGLAAGILLAGLTGRAGRVTAAEPVTAEEIFARAVVLSYPEADFGEMVGMAAVVHNRMAAPGFSDTCGEVLAHFGDGCFSAMDRIADSPDEASLRMGREAWALSEAGWDPTKGALYFRRPAKSPLEWKLTFDDRRESRSTTHPGSTVIGQTEFW